MTESNTVKVARLETQMTNVATEIAEVKGLVKEVIVKVDAQAQLNNKILILESNYLGIQQKLEKMELDMSKRVQSLARQRWAQNTISAILGVVLTYLVSFFLTHGGK